MDLWAKKRRLAARFMKGRWTSRDLSDTFGLGEVESLSPLPIIATT